jgi:RNA polymerase-binding transcription factor DksA
MHAQVEGPLSARQIDTLSKAIDALEVDLSERIEGERERATAEISSQLEGVVGDGADYAGARIRAGIEGELMERHMRDLQGLEAARGRMKIGTYGICVDCAEPIDYARLKLNPAAVRCAACQAEREKVPATAR